VFDFCADPSTLPTFEWFACYLTNGVHLLFYQSFLTVLILLAITAPLGARLRLRGRRGVALAFLPL
jgi:polar amino acid transport system permease protein